MRSTKQASPSSVSSTNPTENKTITAAGCLPTCVYRNKSQILDPTRVAVMSLSKGLGFRVCRTLAWKVAFARRTLRFLAAVGCSSTPSSICCSTRSASLFESLSTCSSSSSSSNSSSRCCSSSKHQQRQHQLPECLGPSSDLSLKSVQRVFYRANKECFWGIAVVYSKLIRLLRLLLLVVRTWGICLRRYRCDTRRYKHLYHLLQKQL